MFIPPRMQHLRFQRFWQIGWFWVDRFPPCNDPQSWFLPLGCVGPVQAGDQARLARILRVFPYPNNHISLLSFFFLIPTYHRCLLSCVTSSVASCTRCDSSKTASYSWKGYRRLHTQRERSYLFANHRFKPLPTIIARFCKVHNDTEWFGESCGCGSGEIGLPKVIKVERCQYLSPTMRKNESSKISSPPPPLTCYPILWWWNPFPIVW